MRSTSISLYIYYYRELYTSRHKAVMAVTVLTPFTTTTVITQPTAPTFPPNFSHQPIPIAAIVGGIIGGASLAVLVTTGWICWGKSLERQRLKECLEIVSSSNTQTLYILVLI